MDYEIACTDAETPSDKRPRALPSPLREKFSADEESSALMTAVEESDCETVEELLLQNARGSNNIISRNSDRNNNSSNQGENEGEDEKLGTEVDLDARDSIGNTALHTAARLGHGDICASLIRHGADVNARNNDRFTPFFLAARVDLPTIRVLLDLGAEPRICNLLGETPLHAAASSGLIDVIVTLISRCGCDVNARSAQGLTPLHCAVSSGSRKAVKALLRFGAEVNGVVIVVVAAEDSDASPPLTPPAPPPPPTTTTAATSPHYVNSSEKQSHSLSWKENVSSRSSGRKPKNQRADVEDVRVCVPRQVTHLLPSAEKLCLHGDPVVPECTGSAEHLQRGWDEGGESDGWRQRGLGVPDLRCQNHSFGRVGPADLPTTHPGYGDPLHHHQHFHPQHRRRQSQLRHLHRLGTGEEPSSSSSSSPPLARRNVLLNVLDTETEKEGKTRLVEDSGTELKPYPSSATVGTAFNALQNDSENKTEHSLVEDTTTPGRLPVTKPPPCSRNEVAHPQHPVHASSTDQNAAAKHARPASSPAQMGKGKTGTPQPKHKLFSLLSCHPTAEEHGRSSRGRSGCALSVPFRQSRKKSSGKALDDQVASVSQADTRLRSSPHHPCRNIATAEQSTVSVDRVSVPCMPSHDAVDEVGSISQADTGWRSSPPRRRDTVTEEQSTVSWVKKLPVPCIRSQQLDVVDEVSSVNQADTRLKHSPHHLRHTTPAATAAAATASAAATPPQAAEKRTTSPTTNANSQRGLTPLHRASMLAMESVAQVLLDAGAQVNARTERGETPLHMAALYSCTTAGHGEVTGLVRLLLGAGAEVEAVTTPGGCSPLHLAALTGDALCTSLLLSAGADLHRRDAKGSTPLHRACERIVCPEAKRVRTVRLLLTHGASARAVNREALTPLLVLLMHLTDELDHDVVRVLLSHGADPEILTPSGELPLLVALRHRMYGFAKALVEKGANPNVVADNDNGRTALHYVCREGGRLQLFKLILSKGADPTKPDVQGLTPLRCAVDSGQEAMILACIASGASTRQPPTPVHVLAAQSSVGDMFANPDRWSSPFLFAFSTAQLTPLSVLYHAGCFSSAELHTLRKLCVTVTGLSELSRPQQEVLSFILGISVAPASLQNLTRWKISHLIGCGADRKWRVRELGLPSLLHDFVLFR